MICGTKNINNPIKLIIGDLLNHRLLYDTLEQIRPEAIIHYAEQPSAPYSMRGRDSCFFTQHNNVMGTINLLFAMKKHCPNAHLIKLGTMGEYGTPNIDIEEGWINIEHKGRKDRVLFPKKNLEVFIIYQKSTIQIILNSLVEFGVLNVQI